MRIIPFALAVIALLSATACISAQLEKVACHRTKSDAPLAEIQSLTGLPSQVADLLGRHRMGPHSIADQGEKYNPTDVVYGNLPMRRFVLAGRTRNCLLVAIERGGYIPWIEVLKFEKDVDVLAQTQLGSLFKSPTNARELGNDRKFEKNADVWRQTQRGALQKLPANTRELENGQPVVAGE